MTFAGDPGAALQALAGTSAYPGSAVPAFDRFGRGRAKGLYDRQDTNDRNEWNSDDEDVDEFGRRKKKAKAKKGEKRPKGDSEQELGAGDQDAKRAKTDEAASGSNSQQPAQQVNPLMVLMQQRMQQAAAGAGMLANSAVRAGLPKASPMMGQVPARVPTARPASLRQLMSAPQAILTNHPKFPGVTNAATLAAQVRPKPNLPKSHSAPAVAKVEPPTPPRGNGAIVHPPRPMGQHPSQVLNTSAPSMPTGVSPMMGAPANNPLMHGLPRPPPQPTAQVASAPIKIPPTRVFPVSNTVYCSDDQKQPKKGYRGHTATMQCRFFQEGKCTKGSGCSFVHNMRDVQQAPSGMKKHAACKQFFESGKCNVGLSCPYAHSAEELQGGGAASSGSRGAGLGGVEGPFLDFETGTPISTLQKNEEAEALAVLERFASEFQDSAS